MAELYSLDFVEKYGDKDTRRSKDRKKRDLSKKESRKVNRSKRDSKEKKRIEDAAQSQDPNLVMKKSKRKEGTIDLGQGLDLEDQNQMIGGIRKKVIERITERIDTEEEVEIKRVREDIREGLENLLHLKATHLLAKTPEKRN